MPFELFIFDCDGVLVDSERLVSRIIAEFLTERGLPIQPEGLRARLKGKTMKALADWAEAQPGHWLPSDWLFELGIATAQGFQRDLRPVAGVGAVLDRLVEQGASICVASNSSPARLALSLAVTGLERYFGGRAYSAARVPKPKPAPDLFLHVAADVGAVPERCVVIEDSPSGVRAARAAGMSVLGYAADEDSQVLEAAGARVFESMAELPELLGLADHGRWR
jgi:HAD superfamily hydrolase (TIGR01509 family)